MKTRAKLTFIQWLVVLAIFIFFLYHLIEAVLQGYSVAWTGFGDFISPNSEFVRGKTLWDWMELLIIPLILAGGAFFLNNSERESEHKIAADRQQEAALQTYLDRIADLLIRENLKEFENEEVRDVARIRTLTVLRQLDADRKGTVLLFLKEAGLINANPKPIIDLTGADLSGVDLTSADMHDSWLGATNLRNARLATANLRGANLSNAFLYQANLFQADLSGANLTGADLRGANLLNMLLVKANLTEVNLLGANLTDANLTGAGLHSARPHNDQRVASFVFWSLAKYIETHNRFNVEMSSIDLQSSNLRGADLTGADLAASSVQPLAYLQKPNE